MVNVTVLYVEGCPHWELVVQRLRQLQGEVEFALDHAQVDTPEEAQRPGFRGSPTVLVEGVDPFAVAGDSIGLACRLYATPDGLEGAPTLAQLRAVLA